MLDFEVKRCARRCVSTNVELQPGSSYYSALVAEGSEVVRQDYSASAWQGSPEGALGWWKSRVPEEGDGKPKLAPSEVALELFDRWQEEPQNADATYVLALLLIRKRVFRFSENVIDALDGSSPEQLHLHCPGRAAEYEVPVVQVDDDRAQQIQQQLIELLYSDAA